MKTYKNNQTGNDITDDEMNAVTQAIVECTPNGYRYDGYKTFSHGETIRHHEWRATYSNGKTGRSRRTKIVTVLMSEPA